MARIFAMICVVALSVCGCGGGSDVAPAPIDTAAANVQPVTVDGGPAALSSRDVNGLFTSVTICAPGSTTSCQTIDHIQVDTGSSGLRILASALTISLPLQLDDAGNATVECTQFIDGFSWGPVAGADIQIAGESATGAAIQVIGDSTYAAVPAACSSTGTAEDTVQTFGANGILGVGPFVEDCGSGCAAVAANGIYYSCSSGTVCQQTTVAVTQQVLNPVTLFAADNNGVIIELPSVGAAGAATVTGSLVFGIGTQSNNNLGSANIFTIDPASGSIGTEYKGNSLPNSFIDTGSNGLFFADGTILQCNSSSGKPGFYCPGTALSLSATMRGANGSSALVNFSIADADTLLDTNTEVTAASNLGGTNSDPTAFDWGLPFFFGRDVFTAIENHNTSGGEGPYYAF